MPCASTIKPVYTRPVANAAVTLRGSENSMKFAGHFEEALDQLRREKRYRTFADLERLVGQFPLARYHNEDGAKDVTVWCSNDYRRNSHKG